MIKRFFKHSFIILNILLTTQIITGQNLKTDTVFRSPVDFPIYLSGTFGELRPNHFHAGIDIKTGGVQGKKVHAVMDGYVSRIKISLGGYGKALYITHPNGYVSVYGHLKQFNDKISEYVKKEQYRRKTYTLNIFPKKGELPVKKGEVIALSGNTGGSMGPHLHFEIRKAKNEHPVNPLLFKNIKIKDITRPRIKALAIYPQNDSSVINDICDTLFLEVNGWGVKHYLKGNPKIKLHGDFSFGLRAYDLMDGTNNKNGIYKEKLYIDSSLVFSIELKELSFATTRYVNSLIDYKHYILEKERMVETKLDTNNKLDIYTLVKNNGIYSFTDTLNHKIKYVVEDVYGNMGMLSFPVKGYIPDTIIKKDYKRNNLDPNSIFVRFNKGCKINDNGADLNIPANALYCSCCVNIKADSEKVENSFSKTYNVGDKTIPLQKLVTLTVKPDTVLPDSLNKKLYLAIVDDKGKTYYAGGEFKDGVISLKTRDFGKYTVMIDTVKPVIKPLNIPSSGNVSRNTTIKIKIKDSVSGIKSYNGYLNGKWILMEYEPKQSLLTYSIDTLMKKGENDFKLVIEDNRGNTAVYKKVLIY